MNRARPAIAVDATSDKLLMQAWVNREAWPLQWQKSAQYTGPLPGKLWRKGEESGTCSN